MGEAITSEALEVGERTGSSFPNRFVLSAGATLAITGIAKIWSTLGNAKMLAVADPITGISFRWLLLAVGAAELVIALVCFFSKRQTLALGLVAWICINFLVYRLGLWWMDWHRPCSCLGNLTDALHIPPQLADNVMKVVLAYLLVGSYGMLLWRWRRQPIPLTATAPEVVNSAGSVH